jgi:HAE1 family hydrophobic/amphiphilic exporter-1
LQRYVSEAVRNSQNAGDVLDHVQWDHMERYNITGTSPIGVMAMLGLIVLVGVAVNDAILLVDAVGGLRAQGLALPVALARAAAIRLRPILMTSLTTILALLPLAFGSSDAALLRRPLALTVIGGMIASIAASLFVIPCIYLLMERLRWRRKA